MQKKGKLELTWVGKYDREENLEPRILVENPAFSYGDLNTDNMLIHGDNLLALKALEQKYSNKVKCIYIDPPFNTGQAFEFYDDNLEISIWLNMMRERLYLLKQLLSENGTIFVHIDDTYMGYLMVLMDEIFGRANKLYTITFKQGSATGHKAINPGCVTTTNFILMYAKDKANWKPNKIYTRRERDERYGKFIINIDLDYSHWKIVTLMEGFADYKKIELKDARRLVQEHPDLLDKFVIENSDAVAQIVNPDINNVGSEIKEIIKKSKSLPEKIVFLHRENDPDMYFINGKRILFYSNKLKKIDGEMVTGEPLTTLWDDLLSNNLHNEGGVAFPKGKKPESLIKRILEISTDKGDVVLDSFLGSGTTAAVAHKMGRHWIGIEMGTQAYSHCKARLDTVVDGKDVSGITKATAWTGGGGYKFYELAESLLVKNPKLPVYQINPSYTFDMVAEAICKIEGFTYAPQGEFHGHSSENRFIHVTMEFVNTKYIQSLMKNLGERQSLLVYCKRMQGDMNLPVNVEVKRIPKDLLSKCSFEGGQF